VLHCLVGQRPHIGCSDSAFEFMKGTVEGGGGYRLNYHMEIVIVVIVIDCVSKSSISIKAYLSYPGGPIFDSR